MRKLTSVHTTSMPYTLVLQCCDPPEPVQFVNSRNLKRLQKQFNELKAHEIREGGGGEFSITLYQHTENTKLRQFRANDNDGEGEYVHSIIYNGSVELASFGYCDLLALELPPREVG